MKQKTLLFTFLVLAGVSLLAQNYVSTEPQNKNAILEEFTGVRCPNCPDGHQVMATILANNPGRAFCVAYHPYNSSYTEPYSGDPDFRRTYPNAFYSTPYCGSSRFMPSAFINRRQYSGERIQSRTVWASYANAIMDEPSPANMGMWTNYNDTEQMLYITVEIYYTDDMTDDNHIYVLLSENNLVSQQSGASGPYTHKHTFREAFVGQWGDLITEPTTQGSLVTLNYEWSTAGSGYSMSDCEVLAFIENQSDGEIITGVGVMVGEQTYIEPTAGFTVEDNTVGVGTQAIFTDQSTGGPTTWEWTFEGGDPGSSTDQNPPPITYNDPGQYTVTLTVTNSAGTNTMSINNFVDVGYPPEADFVASQVNLVVGETTDFFDNSIQDPASWSWTFEGGDPETSSEQNPVGIQYNTIGTYDVSLIVENEYGTHTLLKEDYINVGDVGLAEHRQKEFSLYPNPCNGKLFIRNIASVTIEELLVRNANGQVMKSFSPSGSATQTLDLEGLTTGIYLIEIKTEEEIIVEKVVRK